MINGNLQVFLDKLYLLEDLSVKFHDKTYFIHGYKMPVIENSAPPFHLEVLILAEDDSGKPLFSCDASTCTECVSQFRHAPVWDGKTFDEAEPEIECID